MRAGRDRVGARDERTVDADLSLAEQVIAEHEHIAVLSRRVEEGALRLLALQQPVAGDLRTIVGSIHIGADIDRMGALAVHVATISRLRHPECALPDDVRASFTEMGALAVQLARTAQEVLLSRDPEKAAHLRDEDDAVDAEHKHLFTLLIDHKWQDGVCSAVDVALLGSLLRAVRRPRRRDRQAGRIRGDRRPARFQTDGVDSPASHRPTPTRAADR